MYVRKVANFVHSKYTTELDLNNNNNSNNNNIFSTRSIFKLLSKILGAFHTPLKFHEPTFLCDLYLSLSLLDLSLH